MEWFAVKEDKLAGEYVSGSMKYELKEMFLSCHTQGGSSLPDADWVPIPMHPLQAREWRKAQENCQFFAFQGNLIFLLRYDTLTPEVLPSSMYTLFISV
nr:hypothetical protein [Vibrio celticus]